MSMLKYLLVFGLFAVPAIAQQPLEQVMIDVFPQPIPCNGVSALAQNQIIYLENSYNGILPSTVYINRIITANDGVGPIDATTVGAIFTAVDPGRKWIAASGFPNFQKLEPQYIKSLGFLEMNLGGPRYHDQKIDPPIAYRAGDALVMAPYCSGGGNAALGGVLNGSLLVLGIQSTTGDIVDPPLTGLPYVYAQPYDSYSTNTAQGSARSIIPGPASPTSQFRVRVSGFCKLYPPNPNCNPQPISNITHLSACLQSGATSSCVPGSRVELTLGTKSGMLVGPGHAVWTDWTPLPNPDGANFLVTASMTTPDNNGNYSWPVKTVGGLGAWASATDSWNSDIMLGAVITQPTFTQVIDQVQVK